MSLVSFAVKIAWLQLEMGRHVVLENPVVSLAWRDHPELKKLLQDPRMLQVDFDQCQVGLNPDPRLV